ncbi:hypothetical protein J437_LFUL018352 [Ladona fulva]|uniref:Pseudouridine synthase RsuA/RluA-like domain-containing protein n=1 Tax=Ladona fulva TaxID=123851 RepID=A0A8K0KQI3_LADFU|nr:hypothetical protein J437_LFUL018352 [Ladona fulva]
MRGLRTIHRLDRLTSGLLLFGRSPERTKTMEQQIRNRQVQKEYVCRVEGEFPSSQVDCHEPIHVVSFKIGVSKVHPNGKQCYTTFQRLSYNGKTSVVLAKPHTGRMHQIRVHLQYLGYPIVNDPLYNHTVFGPSKGRGGDFGGKSDEDLIRDLISIHNAENWLGVLDGEVEVRMVEKPVVEERPPPKKPEIDVKNEVKCEKTLSNVNCRISESSRDIKEGRVTVATQTAEEEEVEFETNFIPKPLETFDPSLMSHDPNCHECKVSYRDPKPGDLVMYLHAWKYKGPDWSFETELPKWASSDWAECED